MGQVLHGSARTTAAVRRAIQHSQESLNRLSARYGINPKTVAKWRKRESTQDAPMGPSKPRSTVLTPEQEALAVAFRKHTLLPLDDCLYALQASIPALTRSTLHRCLQRHGISRLPGIEGDKPARKQKFKSYPDRVFSSGHRAASVADKHMLPDLLHGEERKVWGDGGYQGQTEAIQETAPKAQDMTCKRTKFKDYVDELQKKKNKSKSSVRAKVEHPFRILKRVFGFDKVRYRGIAKNHNRLCASFALVNLYIHRKRLAVLG